jgi:hypothetical protein
MSRKVFTAGEVLAAADVNSFLMDQTVMSFAGTAARGSAIPTPVTGMTTYLEDSKDLRIYDGSAYSSPFGLTELINQDFSGVSSVTVDNVFTSEFEDYRILLRADGGASSTNRAVFLQFRKAGSTINATNYFYGQYYFNIVNNTTGAFVSGASASDINLLSYGFIQSSSYSSVDIYSPQVASRHTGFTSLNQSNYNVSTNKVATFGGGLYQANDNFDGFLLSTTGTFAGNVKVYGYRR